MTLQDYRYVRPHDPAQCPVCAPSGHGHPLCQAPGCDQLAEFQVPRHATLAEYEATPEAHKPIDGLMHRAVFACDTDEHAEATAPFCQHTAPKPPECPDCPAGVGQPCVRTDGTPRKVHHAARTRKPAIYDRCIHAHREDCQIFTGCQCTSADQAPERAGRLQPERDHADGSHSKLAAEIVKRIVDAYDIPWWTVRHYATAQAQDAATAVLDVTYATLDPDGNLDRDEHGHEVLAAMRIPLDPDAPRQAVEIPVPAYAAGA